MNVNSKPRDVLPIPGYERIPVVGSRLDILRFFSDPIRHLLQLERQFGSVAAFTAGEPTLVCAFGAENNRTILSDPATFNNFLALPFSVPKKSAATRLFDGILSMNGERHKRYRRILMPVVNKTAVSSYAPAIVRITNQFLQRWNATGPVDILREMGDLTIRVSTYCLFGMEATNDANSLGQLGLRLLALLSSPWTIVLPLNVRGTPYARFLETAELLEMKLRQFIHERLQDHEMRLDVLSMLLQARNDEETALTDDEIISLTTSMLFGGQDPIANTLTWTLVLLSQHPDILANLASQLDDVLRGADPTEDDLPRLPLLDAVVNETMRLLPAIVHLIFRRPTTAMQLGPHHLPEGALVVLSPFVTHRHPDIFPNPRRFLPERWSHSKPGPYEYMPYGAGSRLCIGAAFSALVLRIQLATILQRFHPILPPGTRIDYQVHAANLGSKAIIPLRLAPRHEVRDKPSAVRGTLRELVDFPVPE